jgi:hypothetical protein
MRRTIQIAGLLYALLCGFTACQPYAEFGPDKLLFDRAMGAVHEQRFDVARVTLQTLVNTYPDSRYAERAEQVLQDPQLANCGETWSTLTGCTSILKEPEWPQ